MSSQIFQADSRAQIEALEDNVKEFGLTYFGFGDRRQGPSLILVAQQPSSTLSLISSCYTARNRSRYRSRAGLYPPWHDRRLRRCVAARVLIVPLEALS